MVIDKKLLRQIPHQPGVYLFLKKREVIYVGKAKDLRKRIASYQRPTEKAKIMLKESTGLKVLPLKSEFLAFLKEAELIKKYQPIFNSILRDDTNYFYLGISQEKIPKILITHTPLKANFIYFGPFIEGKSLKTILKKIRKVVPFCTCLQNHLRSCLNSQLSLCFGWCCQKNPLSTEIKKYNQNIKIIKLIFSGKIKKALKLNESLKPVLEEIEKNFDLPETQFDPYSLRALNDLKDILKIKEIERIEAYDISHWSMNFPYGVMIVWESSLNNFNKKEYRIFKIKKISKPDDPRMIAEVLERRLKHSEWQMPQLIILDGGKIQLNQAKKVLEKYKLNNIKLTALAKGKMEFISESFKLSLSQLPFHLANFILKINQESHRFALTFHRKIRRRNFLAKLT